MNHSSANQCCCVSINNQLWARNLAVDTTIWWCDIDIEKITKLDLLRMCPLVSCIWCITISSVCPHDCFWFIHNYPNFQSNMLPTNVPSDQNMQ